LDSGLSLVACLSGFFFGSNSSTRSTGESPLINYH
jgi:hypothetical protein